MNAFQKWLLVGSSALTGLTGLGYWWMDTMLEPMNEWAVISHPLQPWMLKAHIVVAPVMVFAVGMIAAEHVWKHYRSALKQGRRSGLTAMWMLAPMTLSGYLIQAVTDSGWLTAITWVHLGTGITYAVGVMTHQALLGRRPLYVEDMQGVKQLPHDPGGRSPSHPSAGGD